MTSEVLSEASTELLLFNFQRSEQRETFEIFEKAKATRKRGCSSAGRAPALQAGGHGFEPHHLHQSSRWEDDLLIFDVFSREKGKKRKEQERWKNLIPNE